MLISPPPTWADPNSPEWIAWLATAVNIIENTSATVAAGFNSAVTSTTNEGTSGGAISTGYYDGATITYTNTKTTRVILWAEVSWTVNPATTGQARGYMKIDGTVHRTSIGYSTSLPVRTVMLLYSADLPPGDHTFEIGVEVTTGWTGSVGNYPLIVGPTSLLVYAP